VPILAMAALYFMVDYFLNDPSFHTKLGTILSLEKVADRSVYELMFGYGFNEGSFFYSHQSGAYSHTAIPLLLGIFGLSGIVLFYGAMAFYAIKLGRAGFNLMIIILVNGFSILDPWQLMIYWGFAYMYTMKVKSTPGNPGVGGILFERKGGYPLYAQR
jgi:hypothetical protein